MEIKIGKRYLVKKDYVTGGGVDFHKDMRLWQKIPLTVLSKGALGMVVSSPTVARRSWIVREEDLIPYRPAQLENK